MAKQFLQNRVCTVYNTLPTSVTHSPYFLGAFSDPSSTNYMATTSITTMIVKRQLKWSGHVVRMDDNRLPKKIMYSELNTGNRSHGGQRKRYKDTLHKSLKQCFIWPQTWKVQALDRKNWRTVVHQGTAIFEQQQRQKRKHKRLLRKNRELHTHQWLTLVTFVLTVANYADLELGLWVISELTTSSRIFYGFSNWNGLQITTQTRACKQTS